MEGTRKAPDKTNIINILTVGVVGAVLVWVSVIALQAYYKNTLDTAEHARNMEGIDDDLREVRAEQAAKTGVYATRQDAFRKKSVVTLKVERAMDLVVKELQQNPRASTVPDVGPQDQPTVVAEPPYGPVPIAEPPKPAAPAAPAKPADEAAKPADGAAKPAAPAGDKPKGDAKPK